MTILLWAGGNAARNVAMARRVKAPVRPGQLPKDLNAVMPSKIPAPARVAAAAVAEQGAQPRLGTLSAELAARVRALLNEIRRTDLVKETDCWGESNRLRELAGEGAAQEGNATSRLTE